jgi:hypothetical protein
MNAMTINYEFDPMLERSPEPFPEPRTIPTGWDLSEYLVEPAAPEQSSAAGGAGGDEYRA